jgi:chromosome segregation ATPase
MKKCVSKTLLMMAFTLSLVGSFVSCKDYDEDVYVDLKSRITKETSLREALQIQVNELQAYVETLRSCQCDLQNYLTKQQADLTYMKISDYQEKIAQISANETAIALLQAAIDEINRKLAGIETKDDRVDGIITQISEMNTLILQVKALAEQALEAAQNGKCECNLEPLENRVKALEDIIAGWSDMITEVSKLANDGLTLALKDSIWLVSQQKTIDSLINEINNRPEPLPDNIIERLNTLEQNTYTKEEINNMISELRTAISDVQSVANQALALAQVNSGRIDDLTARVKDLEDAVDDIQDDIDDINDELTALKNRVTTLEGKVQELDTKVLEILGQLEKLQNDLQKLITGIIVQGTQSPVLGYFNAPLDTRSTVLAVY